MRMYAPVQVHLARLVVRCLQDQGPSGAASPLLVLAYTNHALDQFLRDLHQHFPSLIRCGAGDIRRRGVQADDGDGQAAGGGVRLMSLYEATRLQPLEHREKREKLDEVRLHACLGP